ncbi:TetR/AcrR family transcriptional regulator [Lentzea jiangxiensis]|uniref:DNA-binding transcriptional regulator, AcrR family n=1 Tax=Lentzea jiangxiensis TaxID=641025 RepID=A0A1H0SQ55_9PSEU|nr:TetR/AcrR family transcriptional regulator [Lentzea jiangxiensis]SDP43901.1 DNA-binding transcriptional regulator, AcrR family [Lentzea jiangxiensis]
MATSTRRALERARIREQIIETALGILESEGVAALTVRRIATDIEYAAPIVYQYFANKDALVLELVTRGYQLLQNDMRLASEEPDIDRRILRLASEYVRFAGEHPHLYKIMNDTTVDANARQRAAQPGTEILKELLACWASEHDVVLADFGEACEIVWGMLYGIASLGHLGTIGNERARRLAVQAFRAILSGWSNEVPGMSSPYGGHSTQTRT